MSGRLEFVAEEFDKNATIISRREWEGTSWAETALPRLDGLRYSAGVFPKIFSTLWMMVLASIAPAAEPLTTLAEVRALSKEQVGKNPRAEIEGTVIYFDGKTTNIGEPEGLVIHDGTAGCYVSSRRPFAGRESIRPGTRIRVTGVTNPDSYFPNIVNAEVEVLGPGGLPAPRRITGRELFNRGVDSDWVEVEAVVVGVEPGGLAFTMVVEIDGHIFKAEVPVREDAQRRAAALMQRKVRLQGVVGTIYNEAWQITGRHFFVPSFDQFIPVDGAFDGGSAPSARSWRFWVFDSESKLPVGHFGLVAMRERVNKIHASLPSKARRNPAPPSACGFPVHRPSPIPAPENENHNSRPNFDCGRPRDGPSRPRRSHRALR